MKYLIKNIALDLNFSDYDILPGNTSQEKILPNLSKINIFVGANNSGKSRFMRLLASTKVLRFIPDFDFTELNNLKKETTQINLFSTFTIFKASFLNSPYRIVQ